MRPIEFRGKRCGDGAWVFGNLVVDSDNKIHSIVDYAVSQRDVFAWHDVDPGSMGQFTGLTDCDGVKIFEGDCIRYSRYWIGDVPIPAGTGEIVFDDGSFQVGFGDDYGFELTQCDVTNKKLKVIGNIHEQAEENE